MPIFKNYLERLLQVNTDADAEQSGASVAAPVLVFSAKNQTVQVIGGTDLVRWIGELTFAANDHVAGGVLTTEMTDITYADISMVRVRDELGAVVVGVWNDVAFSGGPVSLDDPIQFDSSNGVATDVAPKPDGGPFTTLQVVNPGTYLVQVVVELA